MLAIDRSSLLSENHDLGRRVCDGRDDDIEKADAVGPLGDRLVASKSTTLPTREDERGDARCPCVVSFGHLWIS